MFFGVGHDVDARQLTPLGKSRPASYDGDRSRLGVDVRITKKKIVMKSETRIHSRSSFSRISDGGPMHEVSGSSGE
jgi:hypothetical protein